jgi:hypothetical protein
MRTLAIIILLCVSAQAAEVWLSKDRRAQLEAITSRPYVSRQEKLGDGREVWHWRNGAREWTTTQEVKRVAGAKARNPHAEAKRELAEARAEKEALLDEVRALGRKQKVSPADLKAVAEKHGKSKANPGKKEK